MAIRDDDVLAVDVLCGGEWTHRYPDAVAACTTAARAAYRHCRDGAADVCILLTDDVHMRQLNAHFRGIDQPTNVLSFPADHAADAAMRRMMLGDIAVGLETVEREAAIDGKAVCHHLQHLIIHAMLHLLGYDHETNAEAEIMERLEVVILAALGVDDPYRDGDGDLE